LFQNRSIWFAPICALPLCVGACGEDSTSAPEDDESVADYVASVSVDDMEGVFRTTAIPRPRAVGPTVSVEGNLTIVNGGTASMEMTSETPFETIYVAGSAPISGLFIPISGFFEVALPEPTTSADLLITFPQALPSEEFGLYFSAADAEGNVGPVADMAFEALFVGTGDVQVTVAWNTDSDVDLHVVDPAGEEIYWANRQSASGGQLDLDSNAACAGDNVRNENITWAEGTAPEGLYTVRVDYWSSCDASQTDYTVLTNDGGDIHVYHGTFSGAGDNGGMGSGIQIATFTRTEGPAAMPYVPRSDLPVGPTTKTEGGGRHED
jgi:hypothetical protein